MLFRLTRVIFPAAKAHHNWVLPLLDLATTNYPDQDNSKSDPLTKTAFPSFFPRTSDYPAKDQDSLTG
jgi:hypothetical protein